VAAISLSAEGRPLSIKMAPVPIGIFIVAVSLNVFLAKGGSQLAPPGTIYMGGKFTIPN